MEPVTLRRPDIITKFTAMAEKISFPGFGEFEFWLHQTDDYFEDGEPQRTWAISDGLTGARYVYGEDRTDAIKRMEALIQKQGKRKIKEVVNTLAQRIREIENC
ncbi:hypothetical protein [Chitinophaga sp. YIM B06452]|uniref:hypothetical protein n=1 Tax=Chitinophaga sp. YIM B06452 TaxID=3082158 RepID=UPI0031FF441E